MCMIALHLQRSLVNCLGLLMIQTIWRLLIASLRQRVSETDQVVSQIGQLGFEEVQGKAAALPFHMRGAQQVLWRCNRPATLPLVVDAAGRPGMASLRRGREDCVRVDSAHAKRTCACKTHSTMKTPSDFGYITHRRRADQFRRLKHESTTLCPACLYQVVTKLHTCCSASTAERVVSFEHTSCAMS